MFSQKTKIKKRIRLGTKFILKPDQFNCNEEFDLFCLLSISKMTTTPHRGLEVGNLASEAQPQSSLNSEEKGIKFLIQCFRWKFEIQKLGGNFCLQEPYSHI